MDQPSEHLHESAQSCSPATLAADTAPCSPLQVDLLWLPKAGNTVAEYEDAWALTSTDDQSAPFACAVTDGATETSFAQSWAQLLATAYCESGETGAPFLAALATAQTTWLDELQTRSLPWYAEEKARQGAFAALIGLTLLPDRSGDGTWQALAAGDACLFQVRGETHLLAFPLEQSDHFTSRPQLLSSVAPLTTGEALPLLEVGGRWCPGDRFYLLTDALAHWALTLVAAAKAPWSSLDQLLAAGSGAALLDWAAAERAAKRLRNDDLTLVRVTVEG